MADRKVETSPLVYARVGGVLYLFIIAAGVFAEVFFRDKLIVSGDAAATANNIMASQSLFRVSIAVEQVWLLCAVAVSVILYVLLGPVNNTLALLATFFNLVSIVIEAVASVSLFAALFPLGSTSYLKAFDPAQLQALAFLSLKSYDYGFAASLVFFGSCLFVYGYLIFKSGFFPKTIGILLIVASLSYLINSFSLYLAPTFANTIFPILVLAFIGELSFCLWLIVKGVNLDQWNAQRRSVTLQ